MRVRGNCVTVLNPAPIKSPGVRPYSTMLYFLGVGDVILRVAAPAALFATTVNAVKDTRPNDYILVAVPGSRHMPRA